MKTKQFLFLGLVFLSTQLMSSQINTAIGGSTMVKPNVPTGNTNVGIGTNTPTQKLEVIGNIKGIKAIFPGNELSNQTFVDWNGAIDSSIFFLEEKLIHCTQIEDYLIFMICQCQVLIMLN